MIDYICERLDHDVVKNRAPLRADRRMVCLCGKADLGPAMAWWEARCWCGHVTRSETRRRHGSGDVHSWAGICAACDRQIKGLYRDFQPAAPWRLALAPFVRAWDWLRASPSKTWALATGGTT